jgi:hypothetical protein
MGGYRDPLFGALLALFFGAVALDLSRRSDQPRKRPWTRAFGSGV